MTAQNATKITALLAETLEADRDSWKLTSPVEFEVQVYNP